MKKKDQKNEISMPVVEIKRHMSALSEDFQSRVAVIGEQYTGIQKTLGSNTEMIARLAEDVEIIKSNVEFLKGGMKKKVDYDEFISLERRLSLVETKLRR